jgi:hypothetical protein
LNTLSGQSGVEKLRASVIKIGDRFDHLGQTFALSGADKYRKRLKKQMPVRRLAFGGMNERSGSLLGGLDPEGIEQQAAGHCHRHKPAQEDKGHGPVSQYSPDGLFKQTHYVSFIQ